MRRMRALVTIMASLSLIGSGHFASTDLAFAERPPEPSDAPQTVSICTSGQRASLVSTDGEIAITVFPTMPSNVRLSLRSPLPVSTIPAPPGIRVGGDLFEITASGCSGGSYSILPAEVNLGIRYSNLDVSAYDERRLFIATLNPVTNAWEDAIKLATDPAANYVSATIARPGLYTVYYDVP